MCRISDQQKRLLLLSQAAAFYRFLQNGAPWNSQKAQQGSNHQAGLLRVYHKLQKLLNHQCHRKRKDLHGIRLRDGSLQTVLHCKICPGLWRIFLKTTDFRKNSMDRPGLFLWESVLWKKAARTDTFFSMRECSLEKISRMDTIFSKEGEYLEKSPQSDVIFSIEEQCSKKSPQPDVIFSIGVQCSEKSAYMDIIFFYG